VESPVILKPGALVQSVQSSQGEILTLSSPKT
jgi:hypothetical protein